MIDHYSSNVGLSLVSESFTVPLAKIGPGYVVLETPAELPLCEADLIMTVDGDERRWRVRISGDRPPFDDSVAVSVID